MEPYFYVRDRNSQQKLLPTYHKMKQIALIFVNNDETLSKKAASTIQKVQADTNSLDKTVVSLIEENM